MVDGGECQAGRHALGVAGGRRLRVLPAAIRQPVGPQYFDGVLPDLNARAAMRMDPVALTAAVP
jgi:hypothetical protein